MSDIVIETQNLTKRYGEIVAVDNLNLKIRAGEVFGILGPNGSGKTTTILMLLGLTEPTDGWARVLGFDPMRQPLEVKSRVGYLPIKSASMTTSRPERTSHIRPSSMGWRAPLPSAESLTRWSAWA